MSWAIEMQRIRMKKEVKGMEEKNDLKKDRKVKEELEANKKKNRHRVWEKIKEINNWAMK